MKTQTGWKTGLNLVLAAWLIVSPWIVVPTTTAASVNAWVVGAVVLVAAMASMRARRPEDVKWINVLLGAWLFAAPWVLGFATAMNVAWNAWIVGGAIALLALWSASEISARRRAVRRESRSG